MDNGTTSSTELFFDHASIDYPILDCDAHVNEPPDTWVGRVPAKFKDRAPKVVHRDEGDYWSFNDGESMRPVGLTATAGLSFLDFAPVGGSYEAMRPGSFDTKARLADMDIDGMYLQVLYPSVTLLGAKIYGSEPELQVACVRAYNDWLAEFCEGSEGRLIGQAILPTTGVDDTLAEMKRALDLGHRGVVISAYPNGGLTPEAEDEAFWALAQETDTPVAVHIGSFLPSVAGGGGPSNMNTPMFMGAAGATKSGSHTLPVVSQLLFTGVFEKFTDIKLLLVESNIGWIPTLLEQIDDMVHDDARLEEPRALWDVLGTSRVPVVMTFLADRLEDFAAAMPALPDVPLAVDHCAFADLSQGIPEALAALGAFPNVYLKVSTHALRSAGKGGDAADAVAELAAGFDGRLMRDLSTGAGRMTAASVCLSLARARRGRGARPGPASGPCRSRRRRRWPPGH